MQEKTPLRPLLLEGRSLQSLILSRIREKIAEIASIYPSYLPRVAILLVGDDASSLVYVRQKKLSGENIGVQVDLHHVPSSTTEDDLLEQIRTLNEDPLIHGILVQFPLPSHISTSEVAKNIAPEKDIDGIHPYNMGCLLTEYPPLFVPATPLGITKLLLHYKIPIASKNIVIINRSTIVGKPLACLLSSRKFYGNATVTLCHSQTKDLLQHTKMADILVSATSLPHFITEDMLKPQSIIVDLGQSVQIHNGKRYITGDVKIEEENSKISAITPVPGGVGPTTVASLMENIFRASLIHTNIPLASVDYDFF